MDELDEPHELAVLVSEYVRGLALTAKQIDSLVRLYLNVRREPKLCDGTGRAPHYSLRTLCRALRHANANTCCNATRALYEVKQASKELNLGFK